MPEHIISKTYFATDLENLEENYKGKEVFTITIDTSNNPTDLEDNTFILPFERVESLDYRMCFEWGDNSVTLLKGNDSLTEETCTHTYAESGIYVVKVYSVEDKMPVINFYDNYSSVSFNPYKIVSVDTPLLEMDTIDVSNMFRYCVQLEDLCSDLLINNKQIEVINNLFTNCYSLSKIEEWFQYTPELTSCIEVFLNCFNIKSIPSNLFINGTKVESYRGCFNGCTEISYIPDNLFSHSLTVTDMSEVFSSCRKITNIPSNLFSNTIVIDGVLVDSCTNISTFNGTFSNTSITFIPENLFIKNSMVTDLGHCFSNCSELIEIPENLLQNLEDLIDVNNLFSGCGLIIEIPLYLFSNNNKLEDLSYTFSGCINIINIPSDLFINNTNVKTFEGTFQNTGITNIPANIFINTVATNFISTFADCNNIIELRFNDKTNIFPETAEDFTNVFSNCENLVSIINLSSSPNAKTFEGALRGCSALENIDNVFIIDATKATSFKEMFEDCISLVYIPQNLFAPHKSANSFYRTFYNCMSIKLESSMFGYDYQNRFSGQTVDFKECFYVEASVPKERGTAPDLWNFIQNNPVTFDCFGGDNSVLNIENYMSIPEVWGGKTAREEKFEFTIKTTNSNQTFVLPFPIGTTDDPSLLYNMMIDWGDSTQSYIKSTDVITINTWSHQYTNPDEYTVSIQSESLRMPPFNFKNNPTSKDLLISINTPFLGMCQRNLSNPINCTDLSGLFKNCTNLANVCDNLFRYNTTALILDELFMGCSKLTYLPDSLFNYLFYANSFINVFSGSGLVTIPAGLFDNLYEATTFEGVFENCSALVTIPDDLFWENSKVTNFSIAFKNCIKLTMLENIFSSKENKSTRFVDKDMNFDSMFELTDEFEGGIGKAPDLWNYSMASSSYASCFKGTQNAVDNYEEIPNNWK